MAETTQDPDLIETRSQQTPLGIYDRPKPELITGTEVIAIGLTAFWLLAILLFFLLTPSDPSRSGSADNGLQRLMVLIAIVMPIALIWLAAVAARAAQSMREESARLQASIDAIRQTYVAQMQGVSTGVEAGSVSRKLDEIAAATRKTETVLATFSSRREPQRATASAAEPAEIIEDQPTLALGTPAADLEPPLATEDFIKALNFPQTAEDEEGFIALRRALKDRPSSQLVQAAQDVLTLLSQDGIYTDDLTPDRARPEIWRHFAQGLRGRPIAPLGGIRDRSSLALTAGRMKQDPIFRDTAHHFLRLFDKTFAEFETRATDGEIAAFADTRTARAFMLLGRVAGTFD